MTKNEVLEEYIAQTPLGRLEKPEDVAKIVLFWRVVTQIL